MITGAESAVKTLKAHGVRHAFGIPGVQNLEYFDAFTSEGMDVVLTSHELGASFMADAAGRVTGEPGVVIVVPGPGLTNIFTGLGEALLDSAPVVVLVPGVRSDSKQDYQLHEINHEGAAENLSKLFIKVERGDEIAGAVARAVQVAKSGEPGPVIVEVPFNVLMDNVKHKDVEVLAPEFPEPSEADLDRAAELILSARQPGIHAGFGASDSSALIMELASRLDAPVSTTISGRGVIPEDHDLSVGFGFGNFGTRLAEKTFKQVDLVIAVGCKFSEVGSGGYGLKMPKLIHIDANPATVGRNYKAEVGLAGDAGKILKALIKRIEDKKPIIESSALRDSIREAHEKHAKKMLSLKPWKDAVNPVAILTELRKLMPRDGILTTDSGAHTSWVLSAYDAYKPRTVLSPIDFSSMGYGVPAAIGAMVAAPGRKVVAVVGDGGLLMTGSEFLTAARLGLPLMVVLFNDQALGMIKQTQERVYQRAGAVDICMDWQSYAGAFGFDYVLIKNDSEVQNGLEKAFNSGGPVLVDARIEYRGLNRLILGSAVSYAKRTPPSVIARIAARAIWRSLFE